MVKKNTEEKSVNTEKSAAITVSIEEFVITMNAEPIEMRSAFVTYLKTNKEPLNDEFTNFEKKYNDFKHREVH